MSKKILVIGGTRGTGKSAIEQSLALGYSVTILARDTAKAKSLFENTVNIIYGDVTRPDSLQAAISNDFDSIIYTVDITGGVGGRGFFANRQRVRAIVYEGVVNTVNACNRQGYENQFMLLTTLGLEKSSLIMTVLDTIKSGVIQSSRDKADYLINSGIPYTIVQAGALHDGRTSKLPLTIVLEEVEMKLSYGISRFHLAQVIIATIGNQCALNRVFSVYGGQESILDTDLIQTQLNELLTR